MKQKIKAYLVAGLDYRNQPHHYMLLATKMEDFAGYAFISEVEVEVEVPDNVDFTVLAVQKLQAQKQVVQAKALRDLAELDTQIQELQALEMA